MRKGLLWLAWTLAGVSALQAQELRCNISVNSSRIQGTNKSVFNTLQRDLYEFVNATAWTTNIFAQDERIECSIFITINEQTGTSDFKGTLQVQSSRPVYGSAYTSPVFNFMDNDIAFQYLEYDKLEFNENQYSSLVSLVAFYAYIIIGLDYDTFSLRGGTEWFKKAEQIVLLAQNATESGWKPYDGSRNNRYWMIENILNTKYNPERGAYYKYHRLGLDRMSEQMSEGREETMNAILDIQRVYRERPDNYLFFLKIFFDAKADEIVNIFSEATQQERNRVHQILLEIDKANENKYKKLKENVNPF
ncbi:MAG: DUF4835 family protein [Prevotellaceae bacterium]|jgi:hypothetical protein|nr:DUF4835 family protein [Prevotellaceae bacterium]